MPIKNSCLKNSVTICFISIICCWNLHLYAQQDKTVIYLTFDDGPQMPGTSLVFNLMKALNTKATFFMVGQHAAALHHPEIVDSIRNAYPLILLGNHSYTHANGLYRNFYKHPENAFEDFEKAQLSLAVPFRIVRLPGNSSWVRKGEVKSSPLTMPVSALLRQANYNVIGWDIEWSFDPVSARPVESIDVMERSIRHIVKIGHTHVAGHLVILTHDRMFRRRDDLEKLKQFIKDLKKDPNYEFETLDHYPGLFVK